MTRFFTVELKNGDHLYDLRRTGKQYVLKGRDGIERPFSTIADVRRALGGYNSEINMTIRDSHGTPLLRSSF